jgi:hypothetical protein
MVLPALKDDHMKADSLTAGEAMDAPDPKAILAALPAVA